MKEPNNAPCTKPATTPSSAPVGDQVLVFSVVGGLAGSSCCVLQLALNALSELGVHVVGCAGFNKVLGPLRVYLRSITLVYFVCKWYHRFAKRPSTRCCSSKQLLLYSILCLCLTLLPEALRITADLTKMTGLAIAPSTTNLERRSYTVDNMGCEACETHVRRIVEAFDGVVGVERLNFDTGLMDVWVNNDWNFNEQMLDALLDAKGYDLLPAGSTTKKMKFDEQWNTPTDSSFGGSPLRNDL